MARSDRLWAALRMARLGGLLMLAQASKSGWGLVYVHRFPSRAVGIEIRIRRLF